MQITQTDHIFQNIIHVHNTALVLLKLVTNLDRKFPKRWSMFFPTFVHETRFSDKKNLRLKIRLNISLVLKKTQKMYEYASTSLYENACTMYMN